MSAHLSHVLQLRAVEAAEASGNRRPWLPEFLELPGVRRRLVNRVERILDDPTVVEGRSLHVRRLKPSLGTRSLVLLELETEAALGFSSADLVRALEADRVESVSFATVPRWHDKHEDLWLLPPFRPAQLKPFKKRRGGLKGEHEWIAETDVRNFFPSVTMETVARYLRDVVGLESGAIRCPLALLSAIAWQAGRLPVGPDLASVIGNALLTPADRWLCWALGPTSAARWVDDVTFGAGSESDAEVALRHLGRGPVAALGCELHPRKTRIVPAELWDPSAKLSLIDPDAYVEATPVPEDAVLLTRGQVRHRLKELEELYEADPEHAAVAIVEEIASMRCDLSVVVGTLRRLIGDPLPSRVTETFCLELLPFARDVVSDVVAEGLLDLADREIVISRRAREMLSSIGSDANVPTRTRGVAGWVLASSGTFDHSVLASLDRIAPYGARALVTAAARTGHSPTKHELGAAIN
jgi:hypothetical protein